MDAPITNANFVMSLPPVARELLKDFAKIISLRLVCSLLVVARGVFDMILKLSRVRTVYVYGDGVKRSFLTVVLKPLTSIVLE